MQFQRTYFWILSVYFLGFFAPAFSLSPPPKEKLPWFTGPLLTPSAIVVGKGHLNVEPYLFWTVKTGEYKNNWKVTSTPHFTQIIPQLQLKIGLTERIDLSIYPQSFYNSTQGVSSAGFGDLPIGLEIQLLENSDKKEWPLKFSISELFPTGKYKKLKAELKNTDACGFGSYTTICGLTMSQLYHFSGEHYLRNRYSFFVEFPSQVKVKGINVYGGDPTTRGKVFPGISYNLFFGTEYSFTKNWVFALDIFSQYTYRNRFKGQTIVPVGNPSSMIITLAPAIEYNWNKQLGVIIGPWFSIAGKNASRFVSGVAAINLFY